jgi:hypothetical protein
MFMRCPLSAAELSQVSGSGTPWIVGGFSQENLADDAVIHSDMAAAPSVARDVAERMCSTLRDSILPAGDSDTTGRVVVIVGAGVSGVPDVSSLLTALGLKRQVEHIVLADVAMLATRDYHSQVAGFCFPNGTLQGGAGSDDARQIQATTALMAASLTDHFELNFSDEIVVAPVLYGGRASDGNVVAVLSMRVWS